MSVSWVHVETLELFLAIIETGSIGAGARRVGMAQPNASHRVAALEARVNTVLLERTPRGSAPTEAGVLFAERARAVLDAAHSLDDWVDTRRRGTGPLTLRVGASLTIADTLLPVWLAELKRQVPQVRAEVRVMNSLAVLDDVQEGLLQVGFVETPYVPVRLNAMVVQEDELVVVIPPGHAWADRQGGIGLRELAQTPLVVREEGSGTRDGLSRVLADYAPVDPAQVLTSNAAVRVAVSAGVGPAVLSRLAIRDQLSSGELLHVPLEGPRISRPLTAVWPGPRRLTGPAADLAQIAATPPAEPAPTSA